MGSVGLFLFLALMGGLLEEHNSKTLPVTTLTPAPTSKPTPELDKELRLQFVKKCNEQGQSIQYCLCVHDYIVTYYNRDMLHELHIYASEEIVPDEIFEASVECKRFAR